MKKILVTGGAGFIGSHLCERLLNEGNEVICLDNYSSGSKDNIIHLLDNPYFELVRHDVTIPFFIEVDEIYNLACPASPVQYQNAPIKTIKTSIMGAINMLDLALRVGAKILQASTSEVYGDPDVHPQPETYWGRVNPIGSRSCYDEGKRCAESLFVNYHEQNKYGPNMQPDDGRVVSNFIVQALQDKPITIYGNGNQTRSFQYVDDLVDGLIRMMNTPDEIIGPVNIGNPSEFTILELAQKVIKLTSSKSTIEFHERTADDPMQRKPDITKAEELLDGWQPKINLDDGLRSTIDYFKKIVQ